MNKPFSDLVIVELAGVLAGPSVGLFFAELGAKVIKIENPKTNGDVTRSWKSPLENIEDPASAYYWSVNAGKEILFLDLTLAKDLETFYTLIKTADILISNYKLGDDIKLKVDYETLEKINSQLIYASINGFGSQNPRTAYDLILQAESGFMFMNGEKNSQALKMPVALIDLLAGHQLKEAILIALLKKYKTQLGSHISVSLFDSALASLANQATNWLIAHHLPTAQGSLHPNIAPYGELFLTIDQHQITFAIGSNSQFKNLCVILGIDLYENEQFKTNQQRVTNRDALYTLLNEKISQFTFDDLFKLCLKNEVPIGKIRNLKEVFELPEAQQMLHHFSNNHNPLTSVKSVAFQFLK
jgi:crotonobetainyl-CoA:carnitine CoA-transferase CaiB-like acyl-CoA transferase